MSKSSQFETDLLSLIFQGATISGLGQNPTTPLTNLYLALHTANPNENPAQNLNEVAYTGYARVAVPRSTAGFSVSGFSVSLAAPKDFPECTGGTSTAAYWSIGTASSGVGKILYYGPLNAPLAISQGVVPRLSQLTITED